jgi:hypothetical protein
MICSSSIPRRALLTASLALLVGTPALANSPKKKEGEGEGSAETVIKLQSLALPIVVDGRLVNYVFVQLSMTLKPGVPAVVFEGKEPMLRDAIVREAYGKPFNRPDSYSAVDETRLKASILREIGGLIGPGKAALVRIDKQTPRNFVPPPPKPGAAAAARPAPRAEPPGDPDLVP